ncbi:hypothetical protein GQ53DRAFT_856759 [Thozetella sp. PMI_491]|nr:hypothetical protein GQ53DRAFT_856759 [Thozetella sp. PMI_491]
MKSCAFPSGWLDVHAHFQLPQTAEAAQEQVKLYRSLHFMLSGPVVWDVDEILRYNDSAAVSMQMLSYIPANLDTLKRANDYGASIVEKHPTRFGLLAALPTDNPAACLEEISRVTMTYLIPPDGFALTTVYNQCYLGDPRLDSVWAELDSRAAVVHIHPSTSALPLLGKPTPLIEVAFDTTRTVTDMLYNGVFRRYRNIKFILAHCGGALPALSGRLRLLGTEEWIPNPHQLTREEIEEQLSRLYVDTAATAKTGLDPAAAMCGASHCIYGADCGVPCSTDQTMNENKADVISFEKRKNVQPNTIGRNGWSLFPAAVRRVMESGSPDKTPSKLV